MGKGKPMIIRKWKVFLTVETYDKLAHLADFEEEIEDFNNANPLWISAKIIRTLETEVK